MNIKLSEEITRLNLPKDSGIAGVMKNCKYLNDKTFYGEADVWDNLIAKYAAGIMFLEKTAKSKLNAVVKIIITDPDIKEKIAILDSKALTEPIFMEEYQKVECDFKKGV